MDAPPTRERQIARAPRGAAVRADDRMGAAGGDEALARLERSLQSVRRECAMAVSLTRPRQHPYGLPRAAQLGPVAGIPPVDAGTESDLDVTEPIAAAVPVPTSPLATRDTDAGMRKTTILPFHLAPPLAADRLAPLRPPRPRNSRVRGALYILIAGLVAGSIAYQITGGGAFTATDAAQAALSAAGVGR